MARQLSEPRHDRGMGIVRVLATLGESFTAFALRNGITFSAWHRIAHAEGDPNVESLILARAVSGGMPLDLIAPTLAEALVAQGWSAPKKVQPKAG